MISSFCRFAGRPAKRARGILRSARKSRKMSVEIEIRRFADLRPLPAKRQNRPSACPGSRRDSPFCRFYRVYKYTLCKKTAKRESDPTRCIRRPQNGKSAKRQIREMKASAATGDENLGERNPKIPRRGRRFTLCHKRRGEVNGPRAGKSSRLGRVGRYVPPGPRFLPKAPSKAGRGKEQGCKADFLSTRKKFSTAKRRRRCPQNRRNLHTRRCAAE